LSDSSTADRTAQAAPRSTAETRLYEPVKRFLEGRGFGVRGEVDGCDVVAVRGDDLVVVELKRGFTLSLVFQGVERLALTDAVYLAIENPKRPTRSWWRNVRRLCRRLGLGLMIVTLGRRHDRVEVVLEPGIKEHRLNRSRRRRVLSEFAGRSGDFNLGGSSRRPIVTSYREDALRIAAFLAANGPTVLRRIREATGVERAGPILQRNVYRWFQRVERGVYRVAPAGERALGVFADVLDGAGIEAPPIGRARGGGS